MFLFMSALQQSGTGFDQQDQSVMFIQVFVCHFDGEGNLVSSKGYT